MSADLHHRAKAVFFDAIEREGTERDQYLDEACGDDIELRREVESLLEHGVSVHSERPTVSLDVDSPARAHGVSFKAGRDPARIGQYKIIRQLGIGGMGVVYKAIQDYPRRTVALKVVRTDAVRGPLIDRFRRETEVLAKLQHPAIAQLYEAGVEDIDGASVPYFAMELVRGRPLDEHLRVIEPSVRDRLILMQKIASAVHYAHGRGVVHRDLKPSNIFVSESGEPKILDFGVARTTESDVRATEVQTQWGQLIGTIPYMSPEQVSGDPDEIDARSDVYSLGIVLYEILAGHLPYAIDAQAVLDAIRVICEEEPTTLSSVNRVFRGDVETIVAKALAKQRARRYQSANELADDIGRFLRDEPIVARPPSVVYQLQKFSRRHRVVACSILAAGAAFALSLIIVIALWLHADRAWEAAELQREIAQRRANEAEAARQRAESEIQAKSEALDRLRLVLTSFQQLETDVQRLVGATALRKRFGSAMLDAMDGLQGDLGTEPWALALLAETSARLAEVALVDGSQLSTARAAAHSAIDLFQRLAENTPERRPVLMARAAECRAMLAGIEAQLGSITLASQTIEHARRELEALASAPTDAAASERLRAKAVVLDTESRLSAARGDSESARVGLEQCLLLWTELLALEPSARNAEGQARSLLALAEVDAAAGEPDLAAQRYMDALGSARRTVEQFPSDLPSLLVLADALLRYGDFQETVAGGSDDQASLDKLRERFSIIEAGLRADPAFERFREMRIETLASIAQILERSGDVDAAKQGALAFFDAAQQLREADPGDSFALRKTAIAQMILGRIEMTQAQSNAQSLDVLRSADARLADACATLEWLALQSPNIAEYWRDLQACGTEAFEARRRLWLASGRSQPEAIKLIAFGEDVASYSQRLRDGRQLREPERERAARTLRNAATIRLGLGQYEKALRDFDAADAYAQPKYDHVFQRRAVAAFGAGDETLAISEWLRSRDDPRVVSDVNADERQEIIAELREQLKHYRSMIATTGNDAQE